MKTTPKPDYLRDALAMAGMTRHDMSSPAMGKFMAAMESELQRLREANDHSDDIKETTLRRGEIAMAKRILALTREVGLESAEPDAAGMRAEDARTHSASTVAGVRIQAMPGGGISLENQP
jgi:hypothetical protein